VTASDILAKIEKGEDVEYDGFIVKGNLDISSIKLPEEDKKPIVNSAVSMKISRFDGFLKFEMPYSRRRLIFVVSYSTEKMKTKYLPT
jgi:hypothetical protein